MRAICLPRVAKSSFKIGIRYLSRTIEVRFGYPLQVRVTLRFAVTAVLLVAFVSGCDHASTIDTSAGDTRQIPEPGCTTVCKTNGQCTERGDGSCIATSDEECESANICIKLGQCVAEDGLCIAATDERCRASSDCGIFGKCGLGDDVCVAVSAEDCVNAFWCGSEGFCSLQENQCVVLTDEDCQRSDLCKEYGECWADPGGFCFER